MYKIKIGKKIFGRVIYYNSITCTNDLAAAIAFSKLINGDVPPSQLYLFEHTKINPKPIIIGGTKYVCLIKL